METKNDCTDQYCLTCSDFLFSVRVVELLPEANMALIEIDGQREEVDISLIELVEPGDVLLVHGGVALARQTANQVSTPVEHMT